MCSTSRKENRHFFFFNTETMNSYINVIRIWWGDQRTCCDNLLNWFDVEHPVHTFRYSMNACIYYIRGFRGGGGGYTYTYVCREAHTSPAISLHPPATYSLAVPTWFRRDLYLALIDFQTHMHLWPSPTIARLSNTWQTPRANVESDLYFFFSSSLKAFIRFITLRLMWIMIFR